MIWERLWGRSSGVGRAEACGGELLGERIRACAGAGGGAVQGKVCVGEQRGGPIVVCADAMYAVAPVDVSVGAAEGVPKKARGARLSVLVGPMYGGARARTAGAGVDRPHVRVCEEGE